MEDVYHDEYKNEDYEYGVPEPKNDRTGIFVFLLVFKLIMLTAILIFWNDIKPYYNYFFPPEVEKVEDNIGRIEGKDGFDIEIEKPKEYIILTEGKKGAWAERVPPEEFNVEFECRTKDSIMLKLNIRSVHEIMEHNKIMIESVTRRAVNDLNAVEIYNDIGLFSKNLESVLIEFCLIKRVRNVEFTFSASFTQMMLERKHAEEALTKAKYRVEIAKHEAEARRLQHEAEMEALAMKRERMLYETETANAIKELAK